MLCTSLAVLLAACGGGSGADTSQTMPSEYLKSANANPGSNGYEGSTTAATTTSTPTTTTIATTTTATTTTPTTTITTTPTTYNYYVATTGSDLNPGTQAAPFKTILKASQVAVPGTTVHVAPGTYSGGFQTTKSGTSSARIIYVSDVKWGAKIVPTTDNHVWKNSGGYTDIIGFEIAGNGSVRLGIYFLGGNSSVQNNHIHDIATKVACSVGGAAIINDDTAGPEFTNHDIIGNLVHDIGLGFSSGCTQIQGIYQSTAGNVKNNIVYNAGYGGIHLWHDADHVNIVNNTVFNCPTGIIVGTGNWYYRTTPGDFNKVDNNILIDNGYGIRESSGGTHGTHNSYVNNLTFRNATNYNTFSENTSHISGGIIADPQFVNYIKIGGGDYRLTSTSPAIDKADLTNAPSIDFNMTARPRGAGVDIGAYEY